jgi:transcription initiation factor TFIID subunit TAF12
MLKDKLREKESELTAMFEACDAEKESADERFRSEQERKIELESTVRELTVLVEQLKQVCSAVLTLHVAVY